MQHHRYNPDYSFFQAPVQFSRSTDRELLQYCLGAALYMPAYQNFAEIILTKKYLCMTTMVMCFEDAVKEEDIPSTEESAFRNLEELSSACQDGRLSREDIPLMFFRVRNINQFKGFVSRLNPKYYEFVTGFVFPKFNSYTGGEFYDVLNQQNRMSDYTVYGMPILEGREVALKEGRMEERPKGKRIVDSNKAHTLNVRVGATDFSSTFGVRRGIDYTIYDIITVRDCLLDILNTFVRDNEYVVSGPVWEYFSSNWELRYENKFKKIQTDKTIHTTLLQNQTIVDTAIDGLLREILLDRVNGFIGKTAIHPSHIRYVNALQAVTREEYEDACQILKVGGGVVKSKNSNKMNEIKPHTNWAQRVVKRGEAYGVIESESEYLSLINR